MKVKIKYFSENYPRLEKIEQGDFIDLRVDSINKYTYRDNEPTGFENSEIDGIFQDNEYLNYEKGDIIRFGLGVAMELPEGYEAYIVPRSSTFSNWGFLQTNGVGILDQKYCGNNDQWLVEFIATRDGRIDLYDRVCQFRIQRNQPEIKFEEVEFLENEDRGGHGSTGKGSVVNV